MTSKICVIMIGAIILLTHPLFSDNTYKDVAIRTVPVAEGIYMLEGRGGNIGVSTGDDGTLIIDDQFAPLAPKIEQALAQVGEGRPRFIINTHWHGDHTGGNAHFGEGGVVIAHENVRKRLSTPQERPFFGTVTEPSPHEALPVITFDESLSVHFNGEEIRVIHFPNGHTDGDSVIIFAESKIVHAGDLFFNGDYPFIDLSSGGSVNGYIANVASLLENIPEDARIIPGHGPLATHVEYQTFYNMLVKTTGLIRKKMDDGKTLKEIQAEGLPVEIAAAWGGGFISTEKWINIVYESFSRKK